MSAAQDAVMAVLRAGGHIHCVPAEDDMQCNVVAFLYTADDTTGANATRLPNIVTVRALLRRRVIQRNPLFPAEEYLDEDEEPYYGAELCGVYNASEEPDDTV